MLWHRNENFTNTKLTIKISQILKTMLKGDFFFSAKRLGKNLFHCQNNWSGRPVLTFGKRPYIVQTATARQNWSNS